MASSTHASTHRLTRLWHNHRVAPIAVFVFSLLLYLTTLTQVHTFDALSYVTSVERKPWTELFHPHHLAYGPLGALALTVSQSLGYAGGAALPMQVVNAIAGAAGVALFFALVRRISQRGDIALIGALLLGSAYAYWYYAVEIEVYTVATLFLILCLQILSRPAFWSSQRALLALGLAQGGAVLFHQTNVLLCAPICVMVISSALEDRQWMRHSAPRTGAQLWQLCIGAVQRWWYYGLTLVLIVSLSYFIVGVVVSGFHQWNAFDNWLTEYARTGWWGGPITAQKWVDLAKGLADTLAQPGGALLGLLLIGLFILHGQRLRYVSRPLLLTLLTWLVVYGVFFLWWEPDNIEFWIASLPPMLLLFTLTLQDEHHWGIGIWLALVIAITIIGTNYDSIKRRGDANTDLQRVVTHELAIHIQASDLLLIPDGLIELYLPYYAQHDNFLSINQAIFDNTGNWDQACTAIQTRINTTLHAGARVLLADEVLHPPTLLLDRHHITQSQITACFTPYVATLQAVPLPTQMPAYWQLDMGQARVTGSGWQFNTFAEGWTAANIRQEYFAQGWSFIPETDPALTSPLFSINANDYQAIEIRLANNTQSHDAQLFFAGPDGSIAEERSARWSLKPTHDMITYHIDLTTQSGWHGLITRLRLDPVGVGNGATIRVEWIRLIPR